MKLLILSAIVIACSIITDVLSQTLVVTYLQDTNQPLECIFAESALTVTWTDEDTSPATSLATYVVGDQNIVVENDSGKYENFEYSVNGLNFIFAITNVEESDGGMYRCTQTTGGVRAVYDVMVEVPPEDVTVSCSTCRKEDSSCECLCLATGGSTPSILRLEWKINDMVLPSQPPTTNATTREQILYSSNAVVPVSEDDSVVTCTITGFENQDDIAPLFPSRIEAELTLSSPDCAVSVSDRECPTTVELSCECNGYPSVQEPYTFYSRSGSEDTGNDKLLSSPSYNVNLDEDSETYFVCMGDNGLNFTQKSEAVLNPCQKGTTILPTTSEPTSDTTSLDITTNSTANNDNGPPVVVIVVIVIVVIIILITVGGFIFWMVFKRNKNRTESKNNAKDFDLSGTPQINAVTATTGDTTSNAPVYGVIDKSKKKKSDKTDGNGMQMSDAPEYAVSKPLNSEPKPAPRSSQPPPTNSTEKQELQYADIDHSNRTPSNQIRQPAEEPTEYATVQSSVIV